MCYVKRNEREINLICCLQKIFFNKLLCNYDPSFRYQVTDSLNQLIKIKSEIILFLYLGKKNSYHEHDIISTHY